MSMQCIKTGARVIVDTYILYGDLFELGSHWIMRCVDVQPNTHVDKAAEIHAKFNYYDVWWDSQHTCGSTPSTIVFIGHPNFLDIDGIPLRSLP